MKMEMNTSKEDAKENINKLLREVDEMIIDAQENA